MCARGHKKPALGALTLKAGCVDLSRPILAPWHARWHTGPLVLRRPCDVTGEPAASRAAERHVALRRRRDAIGIALDRAGAGRAAQRGPCPIAGDQVQSLRRVVCIRTWLAHRWPPGGSPRHEERRTGGRERQALRSTLFGGTIPLEQWPWSPKSGHGWEKFIPVPCPSVPA